MKSSIKKVQPFLSKWRNRKIEKCTKITFSEKLQVIEQNGFHHQKGNLKLHLVRIKTFPSRKIAFCKIKKLKLHFFPKKHFSQKVRVIEPNGFQHLKEHPKVGLEGTESLSPKMWNFGGKKCYFHQKIQVYDGVIGVYSPYYQICSSVIGKSEEIYNKSAIKSSIKKCNHFRVN